MMPSSENRNVKKSFRFTQSEWRLVEQKCEIAQITPTQYFQQIAVHGKTAKRECLEEQKKYLGQIAMIGNNINQIARQLNTHKKVELWMLQLLIEIEKYLTEKL